MSVEQEPLLEGSVYGVGRSPEFVRCINCEEQRQVGVPCSCGYADPSDAELCKKCGEYKLMGMSCRSAKCQATGQKK